MSNEIDDEEDITDFGDTVFNQPIMTKEEVEAWVMLKGQSNERWFEIKILDEEVGQQPNMIALMETVSNMIFAGMQGMPFQEAEMARKKASGVGKAVKLEIAK